MNNAKKKMSKLALVGIACSLVAGTLIASVYLLPATFSIKLGGFLSKLILILLMGSLFFGVAALISICRNKGRLKGKWMVCVSIIVGLSPGYLIIFPFLWAELKPPQTLLSADSPDGTKVAYVLAKPRFDDTNQSLWVMNKDGSGKRFLKGIAGHCDSVQEMKWAPDGKMVGCRISNGAVKIVNVDSGKETIIGRYWGREPESAESIHVESFLWSADSKRIFFSAGMQPRFGTEVSNYPCSMSIYVLESEDIGGTAIRKHIYLVDPLDWRVEATQISFTGWDLRKYRVPADAKPDTGYQVSAVDVETGKTTPFPTQELLNLYLGDLLLWSGKYAEAAAAYKKTVKERPTDEKARAIIYRSRIIDCLIETKQYREAVEECQRELRMMQDLSGLSITDQILGEFAQTKPDYQDQPFKVPNSRVAVTLMKMARVYEVCLGEREKAMDVYREIVRMRDKLSEHIVAEASKKLRELGKDERAR